MNNPEASLEEFFWLNNKDFLKFFKNGEEMSSFFKELHKKAVLNLF
mgnify:CR=1 FL=1